MRRSADAGVEDVSPVPSPFTDGKDDRELVCADGPRAQRGGWGAQAENLRRYVDGA